MKLLALDTSTRTAAVALVEGTSPDDARLVACDERGVSTHSDVLLQLIDELLTQTSTTLADLAGIAVGAGPGSFTGLRIGLATAKGLCFATDKPLYTASTLAALALDAGPHADAVVIPVLDAKKGEVYVGAYQVGATGAPIQLGPEQAIAPEQVASYVAALGRPGVLVGTGVTSYPDELASAGTLCTDARTTPSALAIARLALAADGAVNLAAAAPAYRRLSEAELSWNKK